MYYIIIALINIKGLKGELKAKINILFKTSKFQVVNIVLKVTSL